MEECSECGGEVPIDGYCDGDVTICSGCGKAYGVSVDEDGEAALQEDFDGT